MLGRNGEGKSTLLRVLAGQVVPDGGELEKSDDFRPAKLDQEIPSDLPGTVLEIVLDALGEEARRLTDYNRIAQELSSNPNDSRLIERLDNLQDQIDRSDGWALEHKAATMVDRVGLNPDDSFNQLSGGNKSRALLARALVNEPSLLLLDEPTNHLDVPGIRWLEDFLSKGDIAVLFVSHDRAFIRGLANRILDLDRGRLTSWTCGYDKFIERRSADLEAEAKQNAVFDKKLAEEEVWIRKGIQARRTRNEGRVRALLKLREERSCRREQQSLVNLDATGGQLSGRKVISTHKVSYAWDDAFIVQDFTTTIWRGDKIGVVGLNGSGKTTFLQLLLNRLEPSAGTIKHGTKLEVAYFDQHREALDLNQTVQEIVGEGKQEVMVNGKSRHVLGYLQDFLFSPKRARTPVRALSGGEKNRLLLARLFLRPSNLLILDEPTNDLDIETLELLEEVVANYAGTVILVSHDRDFVNNCVNTCLYFDGTGQINQIVGGYDDVDSYLALKESQRQIMADSAEKKAKQEKEARQAKEENSKKEK